MTQNLSLRNAANHIKGRLYRDRKTIYKKNIIEDIRALRKEFKNVEVTTGGISIETEPIRLGKRNFGRFRIEWENFSYKMRAQGLEPRIRPIDVFANKVMAGCGYYHHPHTSRIGTICAGDGNDSVVLAVEEGRIYDLFLILNSILHGYDARSAFASLSSWRKTQKCYRCGQSTKILEDLYKCQDCGITACRNCMALICRNKDCRRGYCKRCARIYKYSYGCKPKEIQCIEDHATMKQSRRRKKK